MVEIFELSQGSCSALNVQFNPESRAALQESLLFHNPPVEKIMQLRRGKCLSSVVTGHPFQLISTC